MTHTMQREKISRWIVQSGEHKGHVIVKDKWDIDFRRADPHTAYYCLNCHEPVTVQRDDKQHA